VELQDENGVSSENELDYLISSYGNRVEHYCTECETKRVFAPDRGLYDTQSVRNIHFGAGTTIKNKPSLFKTFRCSANPEHQILFSFYLDGNQIVKIAEYPSKYDTVIDSFNKYKKVLEKSQLNPHYSLGELSTPIFWSAGAERSGRILSALLWHKIINLYLCLPVSTSFTWTKALCFHCGTHVPHGPSRDLSFIAVPAP
jgi:hypothetical protein